MKHNGMALVTGLLLLAVISVLAVTAAGSMTLQQHQAANFSDRMQASSGADLAASYAIAWLLSRDDAEREAGCVSGCLLPPGVFDDEAVPNHPEFESLAWWRGNGTPAGKNPVSGEFVRWVSGDPSDAMWIMEEVHFEPTVPSEASMPLHGIGYYRIFSRGGGKLPGSTVITETIVARPWGPDIVAARFPPEVPMAAFCGRIEESIPCGTQAWRRRR